MGGRSFFDPRKFMRARRAPGGVPVQAVRLTWPIHARSKELSVSGAVWQWLHLFLKTASTCRAFQSSL